MSRQDTKGDLSEYMLGKIASAGQNGQFWTPRHIIELKRWQNRGAEGSRQRTEQSFLVPKMEIAENDYDLSINRYKEVVYDPPMVILECLEKLEEEIAKGRKALEGLLN